MPGIARSRAAIALFAMAGGAVFLGLLFAHDVSKITAAALSAGWGVLWVCLYRLPLLAVDAAGWQRLLAARHPVRLLTVARLRWIGESINYLLPVAQVGGELARARLLTLAGVPAGAAGASVVVDLTLGLTAHLIFILLGVVILLTTVEPAIPAVGIVMGIAVAAAVVFAVHAVQRMGLFEAVGRLLARFVPEGRLASAASFGVTLDASIGEAYGRRTAIAAATGFRLAGWVLSVGEVWLILHFIGVPTGLAEAFIIESLVTAVRGAFFFLPAGLGAQEGGLVVIGALVGLAPETALALVLLRRFREIVVSVPALFAWAAAEHRSLGELLRRMRAAP